MLPKSTTQLCLEKLAFNPPPFGMGVQERGYASGSNGYRFGFKGQEKDNEISGEGNSMTAEFWEYDSRIGRRWNTDPKPQISISSYACLYNSPIFCFDLRGDTVAESRTKGMNFIIVPTRDMAKNDITYKADRFKARAMSIMSLGKLKVISSDNPQDMVDKIIKKVGINGYVANLTIDFHAGKIGRGSITAPNVASELGRLKEGFVGMDYTNVYLGQCLAGGEGTSSSPGITAMFSNYLDGALVYGNQAAADSKHFMFQNHFVGIVIDPHGDYEKEEDNVNHVGIHTKTESFAGYSYVSQTTNMIKIRNSGKIVELKRNAMNLLFFVKARKAYILSHQTPSQP